MTDFVLGIDIGGTKILVGLVAANGAIAATEQIATPAQDGPDAIIDAVLTVSRRVLAAATGPVVACGVGTAGVVGPDGGIASATDLLRGWGGTPLKSRLVSLLDMPVAVLNDVHAVGLCEARIGSAIGASSALVLAVGTGVGGSIIHDGAVVPGASGIAGSIGHLPASVREGRTCSCGAADHVEAYASGPAMEAEYLRRTDESFALWQIARLAEEGDEVARSVIEQGAEVLGAAVGGANNLIDAAVVVVGGGVLALGEAFLVPLRRAARTEALGATREAPIVAAKFGPTACLVGAGLAAFLSLHRGG